MLSFLYRICINFERHHGVSPNLLYLNYRHFDELQRSLPELQDTAALLQHLDMELILQNDVLHPRVAWSSVRARAV
jgi:hypothetical protein